MVTPYDVIYDGNPHTATGTATGVKSESLSGLDLSGTTRTNASFYVDSWTFTDATGNYKTAGGTVSDTITQAVLSVNAVAASKTYGATDPAFANTLSGFVNGEDTTTALVTGTTACTRTAGASVVGSPYTITCAAGTLAAPNYSFVTGSTANFTIGKKTASVTPNAASKTYGDLDPAFTGTLTGFLAADGVTATYSRTAGETVLGSPYTISAVLSPAGVLSNYDITYKTADFTITKRPVEMGAVADISHSRSSITAPHVRP